MENIVQVVHYEGTNTIVFVGGHALFEKDLNPAIDICKQIGQKDFKLTTFFKNGKQSTEIYTV